MSLNISVQSLDRALEQTLQRAPEARSAAAGKPEQLDAGPLAASQTIDSWSTPSVSAPLAHWPKGGLGQQFDVAKPGFNASFLASRRKPEGPKATGGAQSPAEVVKPTLIFSTYFPDNLRVGIKDLFKKVVDVSIGFGLGDRTPKDFHIKHISRRQWSEFLVDRDNELSKKFPSSGLRSLWTRLTRWLARLAHTWTTPIYFDRESAGDILIVGENFGRKITADKRKLLAETLVRCLQRSTYNSFFELHLRSSGQLNADPLTYGINEALAETNVQVCLQALERDQGVVLHRNRWYHFGRKVSHRLRTRQQMIVDRLSAEKDVDAWFRRMFSKSYWAAFLFQKGGYVEVSKKLSHQDEVFITKAREINPYGPPRLKR